MKSRYSTFDKQCNRRILIVDDSEDIHLDYRKSLEKDDGNQKELDLIEEALFGEPVKGQEESHILIDSAYQGEEALEKVKEANAKQKPYSMAFVDMNMPPGWDGLETISKLWKECPGLPVVVCSSFAEHSPNEIVEMLGESGQLSILRKPFDMEDVRQFANNVTEY